MDNQLYSTGTCAGGPGLTWTSTGACVDGKPTYEVWELVWNSKLLGVKADLVIPSHERWVDSHKGTGGWSYVLGR